MFAGVGAVSRLRSPGSQLAQAESATQHPPRDSLHFRAIGEITQAGLTRKNSSTRTTDVRR